MLLLSSENVHRTLGVEGPEMIVSAVWAGSRRNMGQSPEAGAAWTLGCEKFAATIIIRSAKIEIIEITFFFMPNQGYFIWVKLKAFPYRFVD